MDGVLQVIYWTFFKPLSPSLFLSLSSHQQRIRTSGLILLEAILFGALLLYFPVSRCCNRAAPTYKTRQMLLGIREGLIG